MPHNGPARNTGDLTAADRALLSPKQMQVLGAILNKLRQAGAE